MSDNVVRRRMMVDNQIRPSDVTKFPIIEAFLSIKREAFVPSENRDTAYVGAHIRIGNDRVILDPRTLAKMLDLVDVNDSELVLDVGSAFGYLLSRGFYGPNLHCFASTAVGSSDRKVAPVSPEDPNGLKNLKL